MKDYACFKSNGTRYGYSLILSASRSIASLFLSTDNSTSLTWVTISGSSSCTKILVEIQLHGSKKVKQSCTRFFLIRYSVIFWIIRLEPCFALSRSSPNLTSAKSKIQKVF